MSARTAPLWGALRVHGGSHRPGLWKCADCREQFTVTVGTVFERSKIPLSKWLQAVYRARSTECDAHALDRELRLREYVAGLNEDVRELAIAAVRIVMAEV